MRPLRLSVLGDGGHGVSPHAHPADGLVLGHLPHEPWVQITLSNVKRFLLGTHHQVDGRHLGLYVAEFNDRLNRRSMEQDMRTGLLRSALTTSNIT